jgi:hypothetical protein
MAKNRFSNQKPSFRTKTTKEQKNWSKLSSEKLLVQDLLMKNKDKLNDWESKFLTTLVNYDYLLSEKQLIHVNKIANKFKITNKVKTTKLLEPKHKTVLVQVLLEAKDKLNNWESSFVSDVLTKNIAISDKQNKILDKIKKKCVFEK